MLRDNGTLIVILLLFTYVASSFASIPFISILSISIFIFALILFVKKLGNNIPIKELAFLVSAIQLLLSSFMAFYVQEPDKIFMPKLPPEQYFQFAVPGIILFAAGLFTYKLDLHFYTIDLELEQYDMVLVAKKFIQIGLLSFLVSSFVPGGLRYFFDIIVFLSYIGGIILILRNNGIKEYLNWIILAFIPVIRDAFFSGVFYIALIWSTFVFLYYAAAKTQYSFNKKFLIILLSFYMIMALDGTKKDYRAVIWTNQSISFIERTGLLGQLFFERLTFQNITSDEDLSARITRANQGALVTWVMDWVPREEAFANGSTVKDAIIAAIFPRFLMPNKAKAGGKENFERFTGHELKGTSMNISLLGEAWANYGYWGGLVFMYMVGLFYSFSLNKFTVLIRNYPIYYYFIPFLFIYIIKAEDDLMTPLNHIFKAGITLYILHQMLIKKIVPVHE
nr:hypothetical protein [uncultured Carboxylicivirga sp.]